MTMSQVGDKDCRHSSENLHKDMQDKPESHEWEISNPKTLSPQQVRVVTRNLTIYEQIIVDEIDKCFINWHGPWKQSFLDGGRKFVAIYDLMEGLIHYEEQIKCSHSELPNERLNAIAKAVARLIDYGNAILNIDITIRAKDETFRELDAISMTTIELYKAHITAHKLRTKLLDNYFRKNNQESNDANNFITSGSPPSTTLRVPHSGSLNFPASPTMDRSKRFSIGSNTSINTLGPISASPSDGRRTPQLLSTSHIEVRTMSSTEDLTESQLEMRHMIATIRSKAFSDTKNSSTRQTLLLGVLAKVESLLTVPTTAEKLTNCFDLLDALLDTIEKLPADFRQEEVRLLSNGLLKTLVKKVFIDDRDNCVEFQHSHWTTYLLSLIRMMSPPDYDAYLKTFSNLPDLSIFLRDYLFIIKRLFSSQMQDNSVTGMVPEKPGEPIYPDCWVEMNLLVSSTFLKSIIYLFQILRQHFGSNTQMWHSYLDCLVHFILQDVLDPNRNMLKERQKLAAFDQRKTSAEYVWITWDCLNPDQRYDILEDLMEPLLKACTRLSSSQRSILLPILYDMMQCDYSCQYISSRGTLCNSGSISGRTIMNQIDEQSFFSRASRVENFDFQISNGHTGGSFLTLPKINNAQENSEESLPYLSLCDHQSLSGFQSSSDDSTVLTKFTHLIIGKLYNLMVDHDFVDETFKIELCAALAGELNAKYHQSQKSLLTESTDVNQFKSMARHTSELVAEFIQICLDLRQANKMSYNHLRLLCLFKLILFFRDKVDRIELYLSNLHKLWRLHHSASRYVEAGFTLLEHAKSLPWTNKPLESHYRIMTRSFQSPVTDYTSLKLNLYTTIIEYFDQGQLWEAAVPLCRELMDVYQFKLFDYDKLSQILARLSGFFSNISNSQLRSQPEYFRVSFYGVGFPLSLRDTTMIYRGKPYEKLADFSATLLSKYPDARLLTTLNQPDESLLMEPDAKYLQVNACTPMVDLKSKFRSISSSSSSSSSQDEPQVDLNEVQQSILTYYKHNECDKFEFSRRIEPPPTVQASLSSGRGRNAGDDFANMWRQRIILTTNSLPGMLPFFPVFLTETNIISPIECAIEDLERANDRLVSMVNRFKADKHRVEDVRPLGQLLLGIVDAAVNGGITKYEEAFFNNNSTNMIVIKQEQHTNHNARQQQQNNANKNQSTTETIPSDHQALAPPAPPLSSSTLSSTYAGDGAFKLINNNGGCARPPLSGSTVSIPAGKHERMNNGAEKTSSAVTTTTAQAFEKDQSEQGPNQYQPTFSQLEKLKCLIARQVPLLDDAIKLHRERVADVMRPQHDHLEASFKRLKNHVCSKYYRYFDKGDHNRSTCTTRSFRSFARSPNRSTRSESRISLALSSASTSQAALAASDTGVSGSSSIARFRRKRMSDVSDDSAKSSPRRGNIDNTYTPGTADESSGEPKATNIPYRQLINERRSLPFLSGLQGLSLTDKRQQPGIESTPRQLAMQEANQSDDLLLPDSLSTPPPPPLPSRHGVSSDEPAASFNLPLPSSTFYQSDDQTADDSTYVCLADMVKAIGNRKESNPYVRLSPDSDDGPTIIDDENATEDDKRYEPTLVTL
jgi:hypothetical protein